MVGEVIMGLGIFNTIFDTLKRLKDVSDAKVRAAAVEELEKEIFSARESCSALQESHSALRQKVDELEKEVADLKTWEAEKQRYELKDFGGGTFAYALKPDEAGAEPVHRICPACYQKHEKSILQFRARNPFQQDVYRCPSCKNEFPFGMRQQPRVLRTKSPYKRWP